MLWLVGIGLFVAWVAGLILHAKGWIHLLLLSSLSIFFVQLMAYRKMKASQKKEM